MTQEQKDLFKKEFERLSKEDTNSETTELILITISNLEDEHEVNFPFALMEIGERIEFDVNWKLMAVFPNKTTSRLEILGEFDPDSMTADEIIEQLEKLENIKP